MGDFSRAPLDLLTEARKQGYVGLHVEQGVPLLDRDLNLLQDLITAGIRSLFGRYVGDGVPEGEDGFAVTAVDAPQDFLIGAGVGGRPGSLLVQGLEVPVAQPVRYSAQPDAPALTTPPAGPAPARVDVVHLDAWLEDVDATTHPDLGNSDDIGMQTSTRLVVRWAVRVTEGATTLTVPDGHVTCPLAELRRPPGADTITSAMIVDRRLRRLTVADLVKRLSLLETVLLVPAFTSPEFTPQSGRAGASVQINGTNLDVDETEVLFGATPARVIDIATPTRLLVQVPNGLTPDGTATRVRITLRNRGGQAVSTEQYLVRPTPAFAEPGTQFTPRRGNPGTEVVLSGFNFNAGEATVAFGAVTSPTVAVQSNTRMTARVPEGAVPTGDITAEVRLRLTVGGEAVVSDDVFTVEVSVPPPVFATPPTPQFAPQSGTAGTPITLRGKNFAFKPVTVLFGTAPALVVGTPTDTEIVAQVPAGILNPGEASRQVPLKVSTPGGAATSSEQFRVRSS